jgi:hypothetical protein
MLAGGARGVLADAACGMLAGCPCGLLVGGIWNRGGAVHAYTLVEAIAALQVHFKVKVAPCLRQSTD